eukprot:6177542-Pleurochrysis_carterae.AAC.1
MHRETLLRRLTLASRKWPGSQVEYAQEQLLARGTRRCACAWRCAASATFRASVLGALENWARRRDHAAT